MPVRQRFVCQFCGVHPDPNTQRALEGHVKERMFGEYADALPGRWLVFDGGGPLGPPRYACYEHRGDLTAFLRFHYGSVGWQVWKRPPYLQRWPNEDRENMGGQMATPRFGLRGTRLDHTPVPRTPRPQADPG